jgi:hypothetical protein
MAPVDCDRHALAAAGRVSMPAASSRLLPSCTLLALRLTEEQLPERSAQALKNILEMISECYILSISSVRNNRNKRKYIEDIFKKILFRCFTAVVFVIVVV